MFEDIVQLENEIKEFRSNILASKELLKCLDDLTATMKADREAMIKKMSELQTSVEKQTSDNAQKVGTSVEFLLAGHQRAAGDLTAAIKVEQEAMTKKMSELQASVEKQTSDNTQKVSTSVDLLLAGYQKAADDLTTKIHIGLDDLRQGNADDLSRLKDEIASSAEKSEKNLQNISSKYSDFIARLDASNIDHIYEYCAKMEKSINQKLMLLGIGVAITAILAAVSIIL